MVVRDPVGIMSVIELDRGRASQVEGNIGSVGLGVESVVLVPAVVERGFVLPASCGNAEGALPDAIFWILGEMRVIAARVPIISATQFRL